MRNIIVVECTSTGKNYIGDIVNRGYNPIVLHLKDSDTEDGKKFGQHVLEEYSRIPYDFDMIPEKIPDAVNEISKIIKSVSGNFEALRRWMYLGSFLSAFYFEHMQQIKALKHGQIDLDLL